MKILLLTDIPPSPKYSGGIVLEQLCSFLPQDSLACFTVLNPHLQVSISPQLKDTPIKYFPKPRENWQPTFRYQGLPFPTVLSFFAENLTRITSVNHLINQIVQFGHLHQTDTLWCILEGQTMIRLALPVANRLNVPLLTEIWDPPGWWLRDNHVDPITTRLILHLFATTLSQSTATACASQVMADKYHRKYSQPTIAFLPSLDSQLALPPAQKLHSQKQFIVGIAGQLYAQQEWQSLLAALHQLNWRLKNRAIKLRIFSNQLHITEVRNSVHIEFFGWQNQKNLIINLSQCDLLYLPYWFDPAFKTEARLCFPSKLTSYLASGRPTLFHGPDYAAPAKFINQHQAGLTCHTLKPQHLTSLLQKIDSQPRLYRQLTQKGYQIFHKYFTLKSLKSSFSKFLGHAHSHPSLK